MKRSKVLNKVLFICVDPVISASTRYRALQIANELERCGWDTKVISYEDDFGYKLIHSRGRIIAKFLYVLIRCLGYSIQLLRAAISANAIIIQRGCLPFGPPIFEWILIRLLHKPLIFDIDDALFINVTTRENPLIGRFKMNPFRTNWILRNANAVIAGSPALKEYALSLNPCVFWIPTTTRPHMCSRVGDRKKVVVGWVGSSSTSEYLSGLRYVFKRILEEKEEVELQLVGAMVTDTITHPRCKVIPWELEKADEYFCNIDIGISPLADNPFNRSKCAFKLIQYMAHGIPSIASPVGMNTIVIDHGITGFLASTEAEWERYLLLLIDDVEKRKTMGERAREKMSKYYTPEIAVGTLQHILGICIGGKNVPKDWSGRGAGL